MRLLRCIVSGFTEKSYREALDLLSEMPQILAKIGLDAADLLIIRRNKVKAFDRIKMAVWRVLLRLSAQLHEPSGHAAMDATFFDRENASKNTTVDGQIIVSRRSKRLLSSILSHKLSSRFTAQLRNVTTRRSAGNSPAATRASCTASPPTKATTGNGYVINCEKRT